MKLTAKQLLNLPVYTEGDEWLGHVVGFELDVDEHAVHTYLVGKYKLVEDILQSLGGSDPLRVASSQVRSISAERMIVADAVVLVAEAGSAPATGKPIGATPLATSLE